MRITEYLNAFFARFIQIGLQRPHLLFVIDGIGAALSAFLLGVVLVRLEGIFGIPRTALYLLAFIPILFIAYDVLAFYVKTNPATYLKGIALLNILYCLLSIGVVTYHIDKITIFGWMYVLMEILVVVFLSNVEWQVSQKLTSS